MRKSVKRKTEKRKTEKRKTEKRKTEKRKTEKRKTKRNYPWHDINKFHKLKKMNIINKMHEDRKIKIFNIFNEFFKILQNKYKFEIKTEYPLNLFRKKLSSDDNTINIYKLNEFYIFKQNMNPILSIELGGFGTKINSDIDIDIIFKNGKEYNIYENKEAVKIYKILTNIISKHSNTIPYGYLYDTNFYYSLSSYYMPIDNNCMEIMLATLYVKLISRYGININKNDNICKIIDIDKEEIIAIKQYYDINKNINIKKIVQIESKLFTLYSTYFNKILLLNPHKINNKIFYINNNKYRLLLPNSYIYMISVYLALNNSDKISSELQYLTSENKNIMLYLSALENLIECYYNNKPKYILRTLYSLNKIKINNNYLMDKDLMIVLFEYLNNLKNNNKTNIPYCVTDAISSDISGYGNCRNKIKCKNIKDIKKHKTINEIEYCIKSKNINYKKVIKLLIKLVIEKMKEITNKYNYILNEFIMIFNIKD